VERDTRTPRRFLGGFRFTDDPRLASVGDCGGPDGRLILGGPRDADNARLMIYDARSLQVLDSLSVARPTATSLDVILDAGDCRHVFAVTRDSILKVDVRQAVTVARTVRRPGGPYRVVVTSDPQRLWHFSANGFDACGDGRVRVYDGELRELAVLDLLSMSPPETFRSPCPPTGPVLRNREGDRLYLAVGGGAGTRPSIGPPRPPFEAHLWVIDIGAMRIDEILFAGGFGLRSFGAAF